jgi:hypothetical protein
VDLPVNSSQQLTGPETAASHPLKHPHGFASDFFNLKGTMKAKYRLYARANGVFYVEDIDNLKQESLKTKDRPTAQRLWMAKNETNEQPPSICNMPAPIFKAAIPRSSLALSST